jgi:hypothetical protein
VTTHSRILMTASLVLSFALGVPRAAIPAEGASPIPPRFYMEGDVLKARFVHLWERSPTFREQCRRIVDEDVVVVIEIASVADLVRWRVRARSVIVKNEHGRVRFVRVQIGEDDKWRVHLPHELEHVVEQIDGLDLARESRKSHGLAWSVAGGAYETLRARQAGQQVEREVRGLDRVAGKDPRPESAPTTTTTPR